MKHCPHCAAPFDGLVPFCWHCGRDATDSLQAFTPEPAASDAVPATTGTTPPVEQVISQSSDVEVAPAQVAIAANPAGRRLPRWALASAGVFAGLALILVIGRTRSSTPAPVQTGPAPVQTSPSPAAAHHVPAPLPADTEPTIESAPSPTWAGARRATWARDGSKTITFELAASKDVGVWMKSVRPVLIVRCLSRTTEVFVATGSAASIEQEAGSHAVRLQFDDAAPVVESWSDSVSSQELYAPDGVTLARRLAQARTVRFGFTPYNAPPVVAEFDVRGFDEIIGLVAGTCGWRVDQAASVEKRRAALN
jgi:hypothetical protein